jgi:2,4-dienoyl-CoA reductase-like NADH-dependent reductase (Old Yellow Enzyme family)
MPHLFDPISLRGVTLSNRIIVSPMCQYSCIDGFATDWHLVHLGSRAVGGAGLVFTEAAAVTPGGRISPNDLGIWDEGHVEVFQRIVHFVKSQGSATGIQLAHSGRKASTRRPWDGIAGIPKEQGGWEPIGPTPDAFTADYVRPRAMTRSDITEVVEAFAHAARRARHAGFDVVEIHAAHGYLLHEFLSALTNTRADDYGGVFENRIRLTLEVVDAVRGEWPGNRPLFVRISSTDWVPGGWDIEQSIELSKRLGAHGVDLIDCSSGGNVPRADIPLGPGYQVPFAARIRRESKLATGAVGLITTPSQADQIVRNGEADCVLLARELLRDPYWPLHAAQALGQAASWPAQYLRAAPAGAPSR